MDYLKRSHAHDRLPVAAIHVFWNIAAVDALEVGVEHSKGHVPIAFVPSGGIYFCCIACDGHDAPVDVCHLSSGLGRMHKFHFSCGRIDVMYVPFRIVIVGDHVFQLGLAEGGDMASCTVELHRGCFGSLSTRMMESLILDKHIRGMGRPIHLQARHQPVALLFHTEEIGVHLFLQILNFQVVGHGIQCKAACQQ